MVVCAAGKAIMGLRKDIRPIMAIIDGDTGRENVMRRAILLIVPIISFLAGCNQFAGPLAVRRMEPYNALAPDGTPYTLPEQAIRARERFSIPSDDFRVGPRIGIDGTSPIGNGR
jgi:hypothetical protein